MKYSFDEIIADIIKLENLETRNIIYINKSDIDFDIYAALGLALICKGEGKFEEAADRLTQLVNGDPKNYRLYIDLADCYLKMNNKKEALETLHSFQKLGIKNQAINDFAEQIQES